VSKCHDLHVNHDNMWGKRKFPSSLRKLVISLNVICNNTRVSYFLRIALLLCQVLQTFGTVVDLRYQCFIGHCPLSAVYLVCTILCFASFFVVGSDVLKILIFTFFF